MAKISNPRDIIIAPVVSEKSYGLMEQNEASTARVTRLKQKNDDYVAQFHGHSLKVCGYALHQPRGFA